MARRWSKGTKPQLCGMSQSPDLLQGMATMVNSVY